MAKAGEKPIAVYGAIAANAIVAAAKFTAGALTGSSAMLSEGIHSVADTGNQLLLLLGINQSRKPPDELHPFGHGKELYFWSLIVAMVLFGVGGGMSLYEGISHLQHPSEIGDPTWNYVVLAVGVVAEGVSWVIALRVFLRTKGREENLWQALRTSKDPGIFTVVAEDTAALAGLIIAFLGVYLGHRLNNPYFDGLASIVIGVMLVVVAAFLAYESRALLVGESADPELIHSVRSLAEEEEGIHAVRRLLTMHLGPDQVLLTLDVEFEASLSSGEVADAVDRLETVIRDKHPEIGYIFVEAESLIRHKKGGEG
ncbi:MAG: cation diffusion facilitator family transporter [Anaerolineae bacterium]